MNTQGAPAAPAPAAFLRACFLDVAVRKPGNVSFASAGHRMHAGQFIRSAAAAAGPLFAAGARVGVRIEAAMAASWAAAGCNTNLGILLLAAPIARAAETRPEADADSWRRALEAVLASLDLSDTRAAYRAIALANPGGLGTAPDEDVHHEPQLGLRDAMALAADRDLVARQYRDGFGDLLGLGLASLPAGFSPLAPTADALPDAATVAAVQRLYLRLLASLPDSHIVRKHGEAVAHNVMSSAQPWLRRAEAGEPLDADPAFTAWDRNLKSRAVNPGTTADFTVATLLLAGLASPACGTARDGRIDLGSGAP